MRIEDFINSKGLFINVKENIFESIFQEGNLIEGEILDLEDDFILIHIKDFGVIKARTERPLNHYKGKILSFIIKDSLPDKIELKPILDNVGLNRSSPPLNNREEYLINILKEFNIKPSSISIDFLEDLMEFNLPINKDNLLTGIGVLDKLQQISNIKEDELLVLPNSKDEVFDILKEDIRNFVIIKEKDEPSIKNEPNIQTELKENLHTEIKQIVDSFPNNKTDRDLIKTIIFFIKHNIKPTLNNIKYFLEINEKSTLFSKDFEVLKEIIDNKFTNPMKRIMINNGDSKNLIEDSHYKYNDSLNRILEHIKDYSNTNKDINKNIEELANKIEFLKEMNKELIFVHLPLNLDANIQDTVITLLKKRKKESGYKDKINVFINLNTKRLGRIKISCQISNIFIDVKFSGISKDDTYLFKSREDKLKDLVKTTGYEIRNIEYLFDRDYTILDSLKVNTNTIYNLDVQV